MVTLKGKSRVGSTQSSVGSLSRPTVGGKNFKVFSENDRIKVEDGTMTSAREVGATSRKSAIEAKKGVISNGVSNPKGVFKSMEKSKGTYGTSANMKARKALADVTNVQGNSTAAAKRNISKIKVSGGSTTKTVGISLRKSCTVREQINSGRGGVQLDAPNRGLRVSLGDQKNGSNSYGGQSVATKDRFARKPVLPTTTSTSRKSLPVPLGTVLRVSLGDQKNSSNGRQSVAIKDRFARKPMLPTTSLSRKSLLVPRRVNMVDMNNTKENAGSSERGKLTTDRRVSSQLINTWSHLLKTRASDGFIQTYGIGNDGMKTTVEVILLVHEHINSHILLLKHAESYYMLQGGCLKPGETEIEGLKRNLTSKLGSTPDFKIQLTVKAKLTLAKIDTADLVHEEIHPHLLLLKIAGSYFLLPEIENLKRKLTSMLGPTKPEFMPNWQGNQNSPVTILLAIKDVFNMIQHTFVDKKLAFLYSKESPTKFILMPIIILKHKHSSQKLRGKQSQKFKRESKAKKLIHIPSKKAILIGMTYENLKNKGLLTECSAIEVEDLENILVKEHDFPMENVVVMTDKMKNRFHIPTKHNIKWEINKLLKDAKGSDILFLYVSGHGERGSNQSVGVTSCDDKPLMENYWSGILKKVPHEATLITIMNTCYGGKFFEEAAESEGDVISFAPCGANQTITAGSFWFQVLSPIMKGGKGKTNQKIFDKVKKYMQHVDPDLTPILHCKESSLGKQFLC